MEVMGIIGLPALSVWSNISWEKQVKKSLPVESLGAIRLILRLSWESSLYMKMFDPSSSTGANSLPWPSFG